MRIVKYTVIVLCGTLIVSGLLLALLLATLDPDDYRGILRWAAKKYAGYEIRFDGPLSVDLSLAPSLTASGIRIGGEDEAGKPFSAHIGLLKVKVAVLPLLSGTVLVKELQVDDATVSFVEHDGLDAKTIAEPERKEKPAAMTIPVFESVSFRNIRVSYSLEKTGGSLQAVLRSFRLDGERDMGPLSLRGDGAVEGVDFVIDGRLGSLADALEPKGPYPVDLSLTMEDLRLVLSGTIDDPKKGEGLDIHAAVKESGVSKLFRAFGVNVPEQTRLNLDASLTGAAAAPSLSNLNLAMTGTPQFTLSARGSADDLASGEGTDLTISGSCSSRDIVGKLLPEDLHDFSGFAFEARLRERNKEFSLEDLKGTAYQGREMTVTARGRILLSEIFPVLVVKSTDLRMGLSASSTIPLKPFLFDWLPETGPVNGEAWLKGPVERLSLEEMDVRAGGPQRHRIAVKGRIGWIPVDPEPPIAGLDILLSIESGETRSLLAGLDPALPEFGPVRATARLTGSTEILSLDNVVMDATRPGPVHLVLRGRIGKVVLNGDPQISDVQGTGSLRAENVSLLSPYFGARTPALGPLAAAWRIVERSGGYGFDDVEFVVGDPKNYRLKATGSVGTVMRGISPDLKGIDLAVKIRDIDVQAVSGLFGRKVTRAGKLRGNFTLSGDLEDLAVSDAELATTSREGIEIAASGAIRHIRTEGEETFEGIDGKLSAKAPDMAPVREITGMDLPDLGSLRLDARVSDRDGPLRVDTFRIHADSEEKTTLLIEGSMHPFSGRDQTSEKQMTFEATFETVTRPWVETFLHRPVAEDHLIRGKMALRGSVGNFRIETLEVASADAQGLSFHADGTVKNITGPYEVDLHVTSDIKETALLGTILGMRSPSIRPVAIDSRLRGDVETIGLEGAINVGDSRFLVTAGRSLESQRPRIFAKIFAPKVHLADLGLSRKAASNGPVPSGRIFRDEPLSFDFLKRQDLTLSLDFDEVIGENYTFRDLNVHASLDNGLLRISPAGLRYTDGFVSVESTIDARGSEPRFALTVTGKDIDVKTLNAHVQAPLIVGGHLNLAVDLRSAGSSPRQIASALNGDLGIAIENGQVKQLADLIGTDTIDFLTAARKLGKDQKLTCLVARFSFEEGIGKSEVLYIDTPSARSRGAGTVNLPEETIDLVIQPKPKDARLGGSSAVTLKGPLRNPSMRKLPFVEAARLFGEITMPYVFLPARVVGYVWYLMKNDKDESSPCLEPVSETGSGDR